MAKRVLVVEDNHMWRKAMCDLYLDILKKAGHKVVVTPAANGEDARRLLRDAEELKRPFDLLSLDINLGRLGDARHFDDGRDVLMKAHSSKAARSVIIVTGVSQDEQIDFLVADAQERRSIRGNLTSLLARLFPNDRSHYVPKLNLEDPGEEIKLHMEGDFRDRVLKLSRSPNRFCYERLGHSVGWRVSYGDIEVFVKNDKPGGLRAIALLLQEPNPKVDFRYADLFLPENTLINREDLRLAETASLQENLPVTSSSAPPTNRNDKKNDEKKDAECIKRLVELKENFQKLLEELDIAKSNLIPNDFEIERIRDKIEEVRQEMEFILKEGYKYDQERKKFVSFRNTFSRPDKKATDLYKKRIKRALANIRSLHEECGRHLSEHIPVKGNGIAYLPREPIDWDVTVN